MRSLIEELSLEAAIPDAACQMLWIEGKAKAKGKGKRNVSF